MTKPDEMIQLGFIRGAHALKGQISVHIFSGNEESLTDYGPLLSADGSKSYEFKVVGAKQGDFICSVKDVNDRNAAEALKGTRLYISAASLPELPEDDFYFKDLVGLTVLDSTGTVLGVVKNVDTFANNDALDIEFIHDGQNELPKPQNEFILFTKQNVPDVNLVAGTLTVEVPFGLFEAVEEKDTP